MDNGSENLKNNEVKEYIFINDAQDLFSIKAATATSWAFKFYYENQVDEESVYIFLKLDNKIKRKAFNKSDMKKISKIFKIIRIYFNDLSVNIICKEDNDGISLLKKINQLTDIKNLIQEKLNICQFNLDNFIINEKEAFIKNVDKIYFLELKENLNNNNNNNNNNNSNINSFQNMDNNNAYLYQKNMNNINDMNSVNTQLINNDIKNIQININTNYVNYSNNDINNNNQFNNQMVNNYINQMNNPNLTNNFNQMNNLDSTNNFNQMNNSNTINNYNLMNTNNFNQMNNTCNLMNAPNQMNNFNSMNFQNNQIMSNNIDMNYHMLNTMNNFNNSMPNLNNNILPINNQNTNNNCIQNNFGNNFQDNNSNGNNNNVNLYQNNCGNNFQNNNQNGNNNNNNFIQNNFGNNPQNYNQIGNNNLIQNNLGYNFPNNNSNGNNNNLNQNNLGNNNQNNNQIINTINYNEEIEKNAKIFKVLFFEGFEKDYYTKNGLNNVGLTCYMNSTLQCLLHIPELSLYFMGIYKRFVLEHEKMISKTETKGAISNEYHLLLKKIKEGSGGWLNKNSVSPKAFNNLLCRLNPQFSKYQSNDAKDLIIYLLQEMHEELNYFGEKKVEKIPSCNQLIESNAFNYFYEINSKLNFSIISYLFWGIVKQTTICDSCNNKFYNFQYFQYLSFPLYKYSQTFFNLYKGLKDYISQLVLSGDNQFYCQTCQTLKNAKIFSKLYYTSPYLLINFDYGKNKKYIPNKITFGSIICLTKEFLEMNTPQVEYKLVAVSSHIGSSGNMGHYITYCKDIEGEDVWYKYDDSRVTKCTFEDTKKNSPYLLLFKKSQK